MLLLGTKQNFPREMILDDIYLLRLKLLLWMVEDFFKGRQFSELRRRIVWENAKHVQVESIDLGHLDRMVMPDQDCQPDIANDQVFFQSANDLAGLMKRIAEGHLPDKQLKDQLFQKFETLRSLQNNSHPIPLRQLPKQEI